MKAFLATMLVFLCILGNFATETIQAAVANLEPVGGYYWEWGQSGWTGSALSTGEIGSICDDNPLSGFHVQSPGFVPPQGGQENHSPGVIIGFDARPLVDNSGSVIVTVNAKHSPYDDIYLLISLGWPVETSPWDLSNWSYVNNFWMSWDTNSNPQISFNLCEWPGVPSEDLYLYLSGGHSWYGFDPIIDVVDVYTLTVSGEIVPEPATLLLLGLGGLLLRKRK